jgi:putative transposase
MWTDKDREKYKADGRRYPSDLTNAEWDIIEPLFRGYFTFTSDMREVVNACFYLEHAGCPWRSLPSDFGPHQMVRSWYDQFRAEGVWAQAGADLTRRVREAHGHGAEPTTGILDSQSVVSRPQQGERGFDGNKKIKGIKRHVLSCSLGFVLAVVVTPASVHDTRAAELVLERAVENGFTIARQGRRDLHRSHDRGGLRSVQGRVPGFHPRDRRQRLRPPPSAPPPTATAA